MAEDINVDMEAENKAAYDRSVPCYYANRVNVAASVHDIRIAFGKHAPAGISRYDTVIYLSYSAAKQLVEILQGAVTEYERQFGVVPKP